MNENAENHSLVIFFCIFASKTMDSLLLKEIIIQQNHIKLPDNFIERDIDLPNDDLITIISGIRRCGKSTLLKQIRESNKDKNFFLNFDDERLFHFTVDDFQTLHETFITLYGPQRTFYFDEIQNIKGWERFVRRLHDAGYKIYITGSNANMLSRELGTHLTGRYLQLELYPYSFSEFLRFRGFSFSKESFFITESKALLAKHFADYLRIGGLPEYVKNENIDYLTTLYNNILYRDILVRNKILNEYQLKNLVYFIAGNISKLISYNNLTSVVGVKHPETVKNYLTHLRNSYLIFLISKFDYSIKKQIANLQKLYFIDNGLANAIGFFFSENRGRFLENVVYLELKRRRKEIYYHDKNKECDFIVFNNRVVTEAIQVSASLQNEKTKSREIAGLLDAMDTYNLDTGIILTENERYTIEKGNKKIFVMYIWEWLLGE